MDLPTALYKVKNGFKITRQDWDSDELYASMSGGRLCVRMEDKLFHPWLISDVDMDAEDWESVSDLKIV